MLASLGSDFRLEEPREFHHFTASVSAPQPQVYNPIKKLELAALEAWRVCTSGSIRQTEELGSLQGCWGMAVANGKGCFF